ncbi:Protein of unknown function (DUF3224) [Streptoalloteichus tenebrarius]|uniref:DUF3224 domain-containing protein n=1 Tax=Streptoalloteichus tenebrarius (strain ATCC 17920 / DSM 40477 / JCM 4838 / CBS 697.72 / NBRC 16177 / NCIMB 11028 / NRRL B-12390 / A12253. 1 / ISP 5477) TaxID=1933 RepID=A0ABT1HVH9_STRSD|nr:DUF3224 domain-containing protein [Streptoalloteichus tenebrarius]MCP2259533.1 Protein of unknown function (DUF3224) [Streptoalloteichus tenebrarius]BFF01385.1 DUF3224 domain-containing protein [Streptoalloteichus tenebrarius]
MTSHARGTLTHESWEEHPVREWDGGGRIARAVVTWRCHGDIEGVWTQVTLTAHPDERSSSFCGLDHVEGRLGGRSGGFVLRAAGEWDGESVRGTWSVVPGSGTGELAGLRGEGTFTALDPTTMAYTLDYDLT